MYGGRGSRELDRQSYRDYLYTHGSDLSGHHDSRSFGCVPDRFGPAQDFHGGYHSLCDRNAPYGGSVRDPSFMAKHKIFKASENRLDRWRYPDRVFGDRDHDVYSFLSGAAHEAGRTGLNGLKGSSDKNLLKRGKFSRIMVPRNLLKDV